MATTLTPQQMKEFVRNHFEDFVNNRKADVIRKNMTPDFYDHNGPGNKPTDVKGDEDLMVGMYKAMPDLHLTIEHFVAEGDRVVCQNVWRWKDHQTGKAMEFHGFVMCASKANASPNAGPRLRRRLKITGPYGNGNRKQRPNRRGVSRRGDDRASFCSGH
jgi:SnoaL-like polyketide cyclase